MCVCACVLCVCVCVLCACVRACVCVCYIPPHPLTQMRARVRQTVEDIVRECTSNEGAVNAILGQPASPTDYDCLEKVVGSFSKKCFKLGQVSLRHSSPAEHIMDYGLCHTTRFH